MEESRAQTSKKPVRFENAVAQTSKKPVGFAKFSKKRQKRVRGLHILKTASLKSDTVERFSIEFYFYEAFLRVPSTKCDK